MSRLLPLIVSLALVALSASPTSAAGLNVPFFAASGASDDCMAVPDPVPAPAMPSEAGCKGATSGTICLCFSPSPADITMLSSAGFTVKPNSKGYVLACGGCGTDGKWTPNKQ